MTELKEILTNLLAALDDLSDEAILAALLVAAQKVEARKKQQAATPPTLGISVAEVVGVEDKPG
jgi:hypothetical protein